MSKLTQNEQAEKQQNALIKSGLSKVEKPPTGIGAPYCHECDAEIPQARREVYGNGLCVECAERFERQ